MIRQCALAVAAILLGACAAEIPVQTTFEATAAPIAQGTPVALDLEFRDQSGAPFDADSLVVERYRSIAEDALQQAGFILDPDAELVVNVALTGRTPNGIVNTESSTGRNLAVGLATAGIACQEMAHTVAADGEVRITEPGSQRAAWTIDMQASDRSCFSRLNPAWLQNHMAAGVALYGQAVQAHVVSWLPLLAEAR